MSVYSRFFDNIQAQTFLDISNTPVRHVVQDFGIPFALGGAAVGAGIGGYSDRLSWSEGAMGGLAVGSGIGAGIGVFAKANSNHFIRGFADQNGMARTHWGNIQAGRKASPGFWKNLGLNAEDMI